MVDYSSYQMINLKSEARRRGLHVSDDDTKVLAALMDDDVQHPDAHARAHINYLPFTEDPKIYLSLMQYQLEEYCEKRGLPIDRIKGPMIESLLEYDMKLWEEGNSAELTDANDPEGTKRVERLRNRVAFNLEQLPVILAARVGRLELVIKTITTAAETKKAEIIRKGEEDEEELRISLEQNRGQEFEARTSASNIEATSLSQSSRSSSDRASEHVGQLPANNTPGNSALQGADTNAGDSAEVPEATRYQPASKSSNGVEGSHMQGTSNEVATAGNAKQGGRELSSAEQTETFWVETVEPRLGTKALSDRNYASDWMCHGSPVNNPEQTATQFLDETEDEITRDRARKKDLKELSDRNYASDWMCPGSSFNDPEQTASLKRGGDASNPNDAKRAKTAHSALPAPVRDEAEAEAARDRARKEAIHEQAQRAQDQDQNGTKVSCPDLPIESCVSDDVIHPTIEGGNFIFLKVRNNPRRGLRNMAKVKSLWSKVWMWSPSIVWIKADNTGYFIRYEDTAKGDKDMDKLPEQCLSIGGWAHYRKAEDFQIHKRT